MRKYCFILICVSGSYNLFGVPCNQEEEQYYDRMICHRRHEAGYSPAGWDDKYRDAIDEKKDDEKGKSG